MITTDSPLHEGSRTQRGAGTARTGKSSLPIVDQTVLDRLREDLREYEVWRVFVQNFIAGLPRRIEKLRAALTTGDADGATDAVLSLKTSSQMVGAERLAALALDLETAQREGVRREDPAVVLPQLAVNYLPRVKQRAGETAYALQTHLNTTRGTQTIPAQQAQAAT